MIFTRFSTPSHSTFYGLVAILLWSATVALARSLTEQLGPLTATAAVYLTGGSACLGLAWLTGDRLPSPRHLSHRYLFGCGGFFLLYVFSLFQAIGLAVDRHQVLEIGMVNYLWPASTILFSLLLLGNRARMWLAPGILLALLGIFLVLSQGTGTSWTSLRTNVSANPLAYGLALIAALSWGLYSNLTRRWAGSQGGGGIPFFMLATGTALLFFRLLTPETSVWNLWSILEVLFMGMALATAYVCWEAAMRRGDVVLVAACSYFTPFLSTLVSCLYLQVMAGPRLWVGCAALVAGSLLSWLSVTEGESSPAHCLRTVPLQNRG